MRINSPTKSPELCLNARLPCLKASSGWLQMFIKERHAIAGKVVNGESAEANAVDAEDWLRNRRNFGPVRHGGYLQCRQNDTVFSPPSQQKAGVKGREVPWGKQSRQRMTVLLCVNMDGSDKRIPLVVGHVSVGETCLSSTFLTPRLCSQSG